MSGFNNKVKCSACGRRSPATQQERLPDNGWALPYEEFGYYGGFDDCLDVLIGGERSHRWIFCHDCVVKFLETFPRLAKDIGPNCHPSRRDADVPCCRHAWRGTEYFGKYGPDVPEDAVSVQSAWPDGVWHDETPLRF